MTLTRGFLEGKILSESTVIIGEHGMIKGNIEGYDILVAGTVHGNIQAAERIRITSTGRVFGDIFTKTLVIDEGASFKGNCRMEVAADVQTGNAFAEEDSQWDNVQDIQPEYELVEENDRKNSKRA